MRKIFSALLLSAMFVLPAAAADKYNFDPTHSQIHFTYNHMGYSNITASFASFSGELNLDTADLTKSSVAVSIPIASIYTGVAKLDEHLKTADFFDAAKFPDATFKSTSVAKAGEKGLKVTGDLTIHGVTKPAVLNVTINTVGKHPMVGDKAAGFDATATIKRSDFGIDKYVPNVSDEVQIHITTEAHEAK